MTPAGQQVEESEATGSAADWFERQLEVLEAERLIEAASETGDPRRRRRRALIAVADQQARELERRVEVTIREIEAAA